MKNIIPGKFPALLLAGILYINPLLAQMKDVDQRVADLLSKMTLEEKVGQMNQLNGDWVATGPQSRDIQDKMAAIREGKIGSMLNINGVEHTRAFQEAAMQSRLKIPLLFGQDVIHGYAVAFPIPLAEAASWDLKAIEQSERIAATEAAAAGIHWTFAPMVDIARDPRWGRVMEGAGEDPYLGAQIARARVNGFQGAGLGHTDALMACVKHYAAYGAAIGGRDYNSVDMSLQTLWEIYLPPYKAAVEAGAATVMNSFNTLNGVPATADAYLLRTILKGDWNFSGFVVSDWGSIGEMINHGYAADGAQAAEMAIKAGNDMDMESRCYADNLVNLVKEGKVPEKLVDESVTRILKKKFEMGLFDDPFRYDDAQREKNTLFAKDHFRAARSMACKSMVLLKNQNQILPLSKELKSIALIGPLVKDKQDMTGSWTVDIGNNREAVSLFEGMEQQAGNTRLFYAKGCGISDTSRQGFAEAVKTAMNSDLIILALGESAGMTGEARSKANIHLPGIQEELAKAILATGKPVVVILMAGRPLIFNYIADHAPAILYAWWLGSEAGNAMADVLYGNYDPSGKLPITFPRAEGQIPIYYNHLNTGRPAANDSNRFYTSAYIDLLNSPRYAFGHGLSYTTFKYSDLKLSEDKMQLHDTLIVTFSLTNTGHYAGEEVVQLYLHDRVAQPVRPVKELKDFCKVMLKPGESKTITFRIDQHTLSFYNNELRFIAQPGDFSLMIGSASDDIRLHADFTLED